MSLRSSLTLAPLALPALLVLAACSDREHRSSGGDVEMPRADSAGAAAPGAACPGNNAGLTLPAGFCATVFADSLPAPRHLVVAPNGDVFVQLMGARRGGAESGEGSGGGIVALRDRQRAGRADTSAFFGVAGGTGIGLYGGYLYADEKTRIVRYPLRDGSLTPSGAAEVIVSGLPTGGHAARNFAIDRAGNLFVNVGSRSNACQQQDRGKESRGHEPCTELETRAGIWRFDANKPGQTFSPQARYATGVRNAVGLAIDPADGKLYAMQHGRDQLHDNWPNLYTAQQSADNPAEELLQVNQGDDFGWPYCYYDVAQRKLVLAPEYGGDGGKAVGRCAQKKGPVATFPGHWAPNALAFYTGSQFPAKYRGAAIIAFHGSWNRAPEPQAGFNVVAQPLTNGRAAGAYEVLADGFAGPNRSPAGAEYRPTGLAVGPDGALYISADKGGRIWKVTYTGGR